MSVPQSVMLAEWIETLKPKPRTCFILFNSAAKVSKRLEQLGKQSFLLGVPEENGNFKCFLLVLKSRNTPIEIGSEIVVVSAGTIAVGKVSSLNERDKNVLFVETEVIWSNLATGSDGKDRYLPGRKNECRICMVV